MAALESYKLCHSDNYDYIKRHHKATRAQHFLIRVKHVYEYDEGVGDPACQWLFNVFVLVFAILHFWLTLIVHQKGIRWMSGEQGLAAIQSKTPQQEPSRQLDICNGDGGSMTTKVERNPTADIIISPNLLPLTRTKTLAVSTTARNTRTESTFPPQTEIPVCSCFPKYIMHKNTTHQLYMHTNTNVSTSSVDTTTGETGNELSTTNPSTFYGTVTNNATMMTPPPKPTTSQWSVVVPTKSMTNSTKSATTASTLTGHRGGSATRDNHYSSNAAYMAHPAITDTANTADTMDTRAGGRCADTPATTSGSTTTTATSSAVTESATATAAVACAVASTVASTSVCPSKSPSANTGIAYIYAHRPRAEGAANATTRFVFATILTIRFPVTLPFALLASRSRRSVYVFDTIPAVAYMHTASPFFANTATRFPLTTRSHAAPWLGAAFLLADSLQPTTAPTDM
eukprot:gene2168-5190_t